MEGKKPKFKFEVNDDLLIYKDTEQFPEGALVRVVDRSMDNPETYLVITHEKIGEARGDVGRMYGEFSWWVHQDDCVKLSYNRPKPWWKLW